MIDHAPILPTLPAHFEYRLGLAKHVTPRLLKDQPVHKWFYFPHSFSPQLVDMLVENWHLESDAVLVDPFVGAGTTLRTLQARGMRAIGADISPLSVFISNVKIRVYDPAAIRDAIRSICASLQQQDKAPEINRTQRLQKAFTDDEFVTLTRLRQAIFEQEQPQRDLLLLALLSVQQNISRAVPDGGWFRWIERPPAADSIWPAFQQYVESMLSDIANQTPVRGLCAAYQHDARQLKSLQQQVPQLQAGCQAIITSPPYPNRHDYTRVFQIELLTLGMSETEIFTLRYESLRSNVEARPPADPLPAFSPPQRLEDALAELPDDADPRIPALIRGYFQDMKAVLASAHHVLTPQGYIALVVGNVRYAGVVIPVDEILLTLGEEIGYIPQTSWVARLRGNSAQQMGRYGRVPARESIVILQKT